MTDPTILDPELLRRLAAEHYRVEGDLKIWAQIPQPWLDDFQRTRGKIADQLRASLVDYFNTHHDAGMALAAQHKQTGDALMQAAQDLEDADKQGAAMIQKVGLDQPGSHGHVQPGTPAHPGGPGVAAAGPDAVHPDHRLSGSVPADVTGHTGVPQVAGPSDIGGASQDRHSSPDTGPIGQSGTPAPGDVHHGLAWQQGGGVPDITGETAYPLGGGTVPSLVGGSVESAGDLGDGDVPALVDPYADSVARGTADGSAAADATADADADLAVARALLGAILAAADSPVGLEWAVSVMRGPMGMRLFLTSTEGRGWLPSGLHMPRQVSMPWQWDELLGGDRTAAWEGIADPARILAEFGLAWGPRVDGRVTAVASSAPIDSGLQQGLPGAAVAGLVGPAYDHDLRVATPGSVDRLGLTGTDQALESVGAVPGPMIATACLALAADAHAAVGGSVPTPPEARPARVLRDQILATVQAGMGVPRKLWDDLREADDVLAAAMLSRRVDAGRVDLGALTADDASEVLRAMVFERRCTELALLLAGEPDQQSLRDAMYAHQQIAAHPQFVPTAATEETDRIVTPGGTSVAPGATAGPPSGVSVAPAADRTSRPAPSVSVVAAPVSPAPAGVSAPATDLPPAVVPGQH